jgi:hypothetical protein
MEQRGVPEKVKIGGESAVLRRQHDACQGKSRPIAIETGERLFVDLSQQTVSPQFAADVLVADHRNEEAAQGNARPGKPPPPLRVVPSHGKRQNGGHKKAGPHAHQHPISPADAFLDSREFTGPAAVGFFSSRAARIHSRERSTSLKKGTDAGTILTGEFCACKAVSAKTGQSVSGVNNDRRRRPALQNPPVRSVP